MRLKLLVIVLLALMFAGCNRSTSETSVSNPTPLPSALPTSTPLNDFDEALRFVKNGQFTYIWVFTRKDGKPFDPADSVILKTKARQIVDFTMTKDRKRGVAGSNFPFEDADLVELQKRYVIEDYSAR
ncbi:MAG TPA: hypothetical protein VFD62_16065 [Pyrinomonadaceae bacterium]|nr:hypothetical protein [Pyrinomonadaceae bacterium]